MTKLTSLVQPCEREDDKSTFLTLQRVDACDLNRLLPLPPLLAGTVDMWHCLKLQQQIVVFLHRGFMVSVLVVDACTDVADRVLNPAAIRMGERPLAPTYQAII